MSKVVDPASPDRAEPAGEPGSASPAGVTPTLADIRNTRPPRDEQGGPDDGEPGPFGPLDRRVPGQTLRGHQPTDGPGPGPETGEPERPGGSGGPGGPAWTPPWRLPADQSVSRRLARPPSGDWPPQEPAPAPPAPPAAPPTVAQPIVTPEQARAMYEAETGQPGEAQAAEAETPPPAAPPTVAQPIITPEQARAMYEAAPTAAQPIISPGTGAGDDQGEDARGDGATEAGPTEGPGVTERSAGADWADEADEAAVADGSMSDVWTDPSRRPSPLSEPAATPGPEEPGRQTPAVPPSPPTVAQPIVTPEDARTLAPAAPTMAQPIVTPEDAASMAPVAPTVAQPILTPAEATAMTPVDVTVTDLPVVNAPVTYYGPGRRPPTEGQPGTAPQDGAAHAEAAQAAPPQGKAQAKTDRHATYKRPEMVSSAETVMLPKVKPPLKPSPKIARASTVDTGAQAVVAAGAGASSVEAPKKIDQEQTTVLAVQTPPQQQKKKVAGAPRPDQPYTASQRRKWISRGVLLAILLMQAVLSLRLHNTAFEDEAQYLYAGQLEILHIFHHQPLPLNFASYFSGAPVLYPVAGAWADSIGGLAAARALSLLEMLATTGLLYTISRRLFNERVAICAALLFSVTMSVTFLGHFATYDATCLFLLAVTAWIMVRTALLRWPVFLLAVPVAALAVAVKYAGALFVPTIAVLPVLTAWPYRRRRVWAYPVVFGVGTAALLYLGLKWGGHSYSEALSSTTTSRAQGTTPVGHLGWESLKWGGVIFFAAVLGTVAYAWRPRTDAEEEIAPAGSRLRRILLGLVLTGTAVLAPVYQAHLHTDVSFLKHIGFGLFFAAPMAGVGLARVMGDHFRRPQLGIAVWGLALLLGMTEATHLFGAWGNETSFVKDFSKELKPGAKYLVEIPEVPIYYLEGNKEAQAAQFSSTFVLVYQNPKGVVLSGTTAYEAAIQNNFFQTVAIEGFTTPATDNAIESELKKNKNYTKVTVVSDSTKYHDGTFTIWVRKAGVKGRGKLIG